MTFFGKTDIGKRRHTNQDCFGAYALSKDAAVLIVCDGMGGENGGEIASGIALDTFAQRLILTCKPKLTAANTLELSEDEALAMLKDAVTDANRAVFEMAGTQESLSGMGTTLVVALVFKNGKRLVWAAVGDSRLYEVRPDAIRQINHDHSYVQYLVDIGEITPEEAKSRPDKNLITRALGIDPECEADFGEIDYEAEDSPVFLLLCSDGLTNQVDEETIRRIVADPDHTSEEKGILLTELANKTGGSDNITVIVAGL